ncbi:MAG: flagellar brake protein [Nitrosomonadales bacterium]|nr:flagellar brake protein [Nitrosomonadales bacterium]
MNSAREIPLRIELLSADEDSKFLVSSKKEILFILHGIQRKADKIALYYDEDNSFILTTLLAVSEHGLWLDPSIKAEENRQITSSKRLSFITWHYQVKVQCVMDHAELVHIDGKPALHLPMPTTMLRLQRRDYYRLVTPVSNPLKCVIPTEAQVSPPKHEVTIMDISGGGVALVCAESGIELVPGQIYHDCQIELPDIGVLVATIEVKNSFEVKAQDGTSSKRAGCEFQQLNGSMSIMLQRYISHMQLQQQT